jgi:4-amino-4-deoxy-L-arabinose transferase-like glycosyltransferase
MANLLIWWRQRTPSEQRLLLGLTGLLAACAFWYGLWQPWRAREAQWRQTLVKEQASLRWMTEQAPRLQQLSQQPAPAAKEALTALVMREARTDGHPPAAAGKTSADHPSALRFPGADRLAGRSGDARRQRDLAVRDRAAVATRLGHGQPSAAGARR